MSKRKGRRGGRPHKVADKRTPSGRASRAGDQVIPPEALAQRARLAPGTPVAALRVDAGTPLAILRLRGDITTRQADAGEKLGRLWRRWAAAACAPPRWPVMTEASLSAMEITPEEWRRLGDGMTAALAAIQDLPQCRLVYALLESVCVDEQMPPHLVDLRGEPRRRLDESDADWTARISRAQLQRSAMRGRLLASLTEGLDAMAVHFRLGAKSRAA